MMTKQDKADVKSYALWRGMRDADELRMAWEHRMQQCLDLDNQHVYHMHRRNYDLCQRACNDLAAKMKLYPQ